MHAVQPHAHAHAIIISSRHDTVRVRMHLLPARRTPSSTPRPVPYTSEEERISGSMARGMPRVWRMAPSHSSVAMSMSIVREAFVTSVMCWPPPVRVRSRVKKGTAAILIR